MTVNFAIVDAHGSFDSAGRGRSYIYSTHRTADAALRAARKLRRVQVIQGHDLRKGETIYEDAVGRVYPRVRQGAV